MLSGLLSSWRSLYRRWPNFCLSLVVSLAFLLFSLFLGFYSTNIIPSNQGSLAHYHAETTNPLNKLAEWDSSFYIKIAEHGYTDPVHTAFFPLYPGLIKFFSIFTGSKLTAAVMISWLCLIGVVYFYLKILRLLWPKLSEHRYLNYLLLFLLFPTAIFFTAAYTESLFAFMSLAAIYFAMTKRYAWSFILAAAATATRLNGLYIDAFILILLLEQKMAFKKLIAGALVMVAPLLAYSIYLNQHFHNPLQFLKAEESWQRFNHSYISTLSHTVNLLNVLGLAALIVATYYWLRHKRWAFAAYSALYIITPFASGNFDGFNRYILMAFPLHWMIINLVQKYRQLYSPVLATYAALWAYFLIQYFGGYTGG